MGQVKAASTFINMLGVLFIVTIISGLSLGYVNTITKAPIAKAKLEKKIKALQQVLPAFDNNPVNERILTVSDKTKDSVELYPAYRQKTLSGIAVVGSSKKGFSGLIKLIIGFDTQGSINNIAVLEQKETPGLGTKMKNLSFIQQFIGKNPSKYNLKVKKDGGEIDALTGATISSRAFVASVQMAYDVYKKEIDSLPKTKN